MAGGWQAVGQKLAGESDGRGLWGREGRGVGPTHPTSVCVGLRVSGM